MPKKGQIRYKIFDMQKPSANRGEECLSDVYVNPTYLLKWKCADKDYTAFDMN